MAVNLTNKIMPSRPNQILLFLYISGLLLGNTVWSQNLILNPSFEDTSLLIEENLNNWHKYFGHDTPDYFNLGKTSPHNNVFDSYLGGVLPKNGDACMGIFCYRVCPTKKSKNVREFIESPLIRKLERDTVYRFSISLCLDAESNVFIRNFGVLFTENPRQIKKDTKILMTKASIGFDSLWLDAASDWITLQKLYKASGNENYIVLGNSYPDNKTQVRIHKVFNETDKKEKWKLAKHEKAAYYYIDDLVLEKTHVKRTLSKTGKLAAPADGYILSEIIQDSVTVLKNVNFEFNSTKFTAGSYPEMEKLLRFLESNPGIRIKINGYTDNIGSRRYNLDLSIRRAEAVKQYLVEKGISGERIDCEGFGYEKPLKRNDTEENRQVNRRVEFIILN